MKIVRAVRHFTIISPVILVMGGYAAVSKSVFLKEVWPLSHRTLFVLGVALIIASFTSALVNVATRRRIAESLVALLLLSPVYFAIYGTVARSLNAQAAQQVGQAEAKPLRDLVPFAALRLGLP